MNEQHQDVDVTGEVLEADLRQKQFQLWINGRNGVRVCFSDEQEGQVTAALKEHRAVRLQVKGRGHHSPGGELRQIDPVRQLKIIPLGGSAFDPNAPSIEDELMELAKEVPDEEWAKLPDDLIDNFDHYVYGTPKQ